MKVLVTGAAGFVGRNLVQTLKNIRDGKDRTRPGLSIGEIWEYGSDTPRERLEPWCAQADFVFHLAGANRPEKQSEFMEVNCGFTGVLLDALKKHRNPCPVMFASSVHASGGSAYGVSKRAGEKLVFAHGRETGAPVLVYRFPNVFGKWCRPNYNSAVATFCYNFARDLPVAVEDRDQELELLYIDDLVQEMLDALEGHPHRDGEFCRVSVTHRAALGEILDLLGMFSWWTEDLVLPEIPEGSFPRKLCSTYLSYLPREKIAFPLKTNTDPRGSFTELLKKIPCGQLAVNISKPGTTRGQHWHHSKWELFVVVSGDGLIRQRQLGTGEVMEFRVSGDRLVGVQMLPGYVHSIQNLSKKENLVTLVWANEPYDPARPDTYFEEV